MADTADMHMYTRMHHMIAIARHAVRVTTYIQLELMNMTTAWATAIVWMAVEKKRARGAGIA
jgi:hypothetical protein